jgi:hypothetical protein
MRGRPLSFGFWQGDESVVWSQATDFQSLIAEFRLSSILPFSDFFFCILRTARTNVQVWFDWRWCSTYCWQSPAVHVREILDITTSSDIFAVHLLALKNNKIKYMSASKKQNNVERLYLASPTATSNFSIWNLPSKPLSLDFMSTLDFFPKRPAYHQIAFYRKMERMKVK